MRFDEAALCFLKSRTAPDSLAGRIQYIAPRTLRDYGCYLKTLGQFFGQLHLDEIHIGHLAEYQRCRAVGDGFVRVVGNCKGAAPVPSPCGAIKINSELGVLKKLMTEAGAWTPELTACYRRYQVLDSEIERALSPDQQEHYLRVAVSNPEWCRVFWYSIIAFHLTFSSDEMRTIRIGDINLTHQIVGVNRRYGKNKKRRREIPIGDAMCMWALDRLIEWCRERGGGMSHHYLFPIRVTRGEWDHEKPMSSTGLRKPFEEVRLAAGLPWFKLNGMRHTAITRLAENGVAIAIIKARAGHMTDRMSEHYTHISEQAHRLAVTPMHQRKSPVSTSNATPWLRTG
jgi:hypothetical protein